MDKNFIKLPSEFNDKFIEVPEDKAAKGSMTVTVSREHDVITQEAESFYFGATASAFFLYAYLGDTSKSHEYIQIQGYEQLSKKTYELTPGINNVAHAWYTFVDGATYPRVGSGKLVILEVSIDPNDPLRGFVKGTIEFMCEDKHPTGSLLKVVSRDFWIEGEGSQ
ncbi:hypothetical protein ABVN23_24715 [Pseudomonas fluorescens]|uniref:hypothetical protein n=1 Tax=Pseudomonas fluorescens TaxID=294 RepID=UPI003F994C3D